MTLYKNWFAQFLLSYCIKKEGNYVLIIPLDDLAMFKHVMSSVEPILIKRWLKEWIESVNKKKKQPSDKSSKGGFTSWLFGGRQKEKR